MFLLITLTTAAPHHSPLSLHDALPIFNDPGLLLVDEPTAALDRKRSHEIVELLAARCHERGIAVVMVTHDQDVLVMGDRKSTRLNSSHVAISYAVFCLIK